MSRISPGTILLGFVAVLFGLLGAYIVRQQLTPPVVVAEEPEAGPQYFTVPMASTDLKSGRKITLGDIAIFRLTKQQLIDRKIDRPYMNNTQQIIGRVLRDDLAQGGVFETPLFYPEGTGPSVADLLEPGQRAMTIPVQLDAAVAGFASPGTWVDVLFRSDANPDKEQPETTVTLLERVRVLALDQETFSGSRRPGGSPSYASTYVTLAVTPEDVSALGVVGGRGTLSLSLRNPEDGAVVSGRFPRTLDELLQIPPPNRHRMEIFRGSRLSNIEFNNGGRTTVESTDPSIRQISTSGDRPPQVADSNNQ